MNLYELSKRQREEYNDMIKYHRNALKKFEIFVEVEEKLKGICEKHNIHFRFSSWAAFLSYNLKEEDDLMFKSWSIWEEIDEILNMVTTDVSFYEEDEEYTIAGFYKDVRIRLEIVIENNKNCNVEYEDVMIKKPVLRCA